MCVACPPPSAAQIAARDQVHAYATEVVSDMVRLAHGAAAGASSLDRTDEVATAVRLRALHSISPVTIAAVIAGVAVTRIAEMERGIRDLQDQISPTVAAGPVEPATPTTPAATAAARHPVAAAVHGALCWLGFRADDPTRGAPVTDGAKR